MNLVTEFEGKKFKKSTFSGANHKCVGVSIAKEKVEVINTKTKKHTIAFTNEEWKAFIKGVKNNEFEIS